MPIVYAFDDEARRHLLIHIRGLMYTYIQSIAQASNGTALEMAVKHTAPLLLQYMVEKLSGKTPTTERPDLPQVIYNDTELIARLLGRAMEGQAVWQVSGSCQLHTAHGAALLPHELFSVNFAGSSLQCDADEVQKDGETALKAYALETYKQRAAATDWFTAIILKNGGDINNLSICIGNDLKITLVN